MTKPPIIPKIVEKNKDLRQKIDSAKITKLQTILKNNIHKPILNLYDSGWEYYDVSIQGSNATIQNDTVIGTINVTKNLDINLPDNLAPYVDINILAEAPPNSEIVGLTELGNTYRNWMKAYYDGQLVFEGQIWDESEYYYSDLGYLNRPYLLDSGTYKTMLYKRKAWLFDMHYSVAGSTCQYRKLNAQITRFFSKQETRVINGTDGPVRLREYFSPAATGFMLFTESTSSPGNADTVNDFYGFDIDELTEDSITITGGAYLGTASDCAGACGINESNTTRTFKLSDVNFYAYGQQEVLSVDAEGNEVWTPTFPTSPNVTFLTGPDSSPKMTVTISNVRFVGYYPYYDPRKVMRICYNPLATETDVSRFRFIGPSMSIYGGNSIRLVSPGNFDTTITGFHTGPTTIAIELNTEEPKVGLAWSGLYYIGTQYPLKYNSATKQTIVTGKKEISHFRTSFNSYTSKYHYDITSRIVVKLPATIPDETTIQSVRAKYTGTFPAVFKITQGAGSVSTDGNPIPIFTQNYYNTEDNKITSYKAEAVSMRAKIRIDIRNPFFSNLEQKIKKI